MLEIKIFRCKTFFPVYSIGMEIMSTQHSQPAILKSDVKNKDLDFFNYGNNVSLLFFHKHQFCYILF